MLDSLAGRVLGLSRIIAILAGLMILAAALVVFIDVVLRSLVGHTLGGADELSGYALAIGTTWALPYCLLGKHNIRVDTVYRLTSPATRALLDCLGLLAIGGFVLILNYRAGLVLFETIERSSRSVGPLSLPQVYPQSLWFAGLVFFTFAFLLTALRSLAALLSGDLAKVREIAGTRDHASDPSGSTTA
ncbi:TRAP transporter small permease subunit [Hoeflea sp.]|uniref:TRAP transporter small permease subunit n=1 Tax=Hoeflea sp. TaxID=1940281 RepID=UPI003B0240BD